MKQEIKSKKKRPIYRFGIIFLCGICIFCGYNAYLLFSEDILKSLVYIGAIGLFGYQIYEMLTGKE